MKKIISLIFVLSLSSAMMAQTTTYRDNLGRKTGTATTDSRGVPLIVMNWEEKKARLKPILVE